MAFISHSLLIYSRGTYEKYTRKKFGPTKIPTRKSLDPRNTHEKKFQTQEIPTRKDFGPTKYPQQKIKDPRRHGGTMARSPRDPRWHETHGI